MATASRTTKKRKERCSAPAKWGARWLQSRLLRLAQDKLTDVPTTQIDSAKVRRVQALQKELDALEHNNRYNACLPTDDEAKMVDQCRAFIEDLAKDMEGEAVAELLKRHVQTFGSMVATNVKETAEGEVHDAVMSFLKAAFEQYGALVKIIKNISPKKQTSENQPRVQNVPNKINQWEGLEEWEGFY